MSFLIKFSFFIGLIFSSPIALTLEMPKHFEFELSKEKTDHLEKWLNALKIGDSIAKAKQILGKPSSEHTIYRPTYTNWPIFGAYQIKYEIKTVHVGLINNFDHGVTLDFNESGNLVDIVRYPQANKSI